MDRFFWRFSIRFSLSPNSADHIIDLGLEGGDRGGEIIATGTPEQIARHRNSYTGEFLRKVLAG